VGILTLGWNFLFHRGGGRWRRAFREEARAPAATSIARGHLHLGGTAQRRDAGSIGGVAVERLIAVTVCPKLQQGNEDVASGGSENGPVLLLLEQGQPFEYAWGHGWPVAVQPELEL